MFRSMRSDPNERETLIIDLTELSLHDLPAVPISVFETSLRHVMEEQRTQPEHYLGFQSVLDSDL